MKHEHTFSEDWSNNETKHWHASTCGHDVKSDEGDHVWGIDKVCDVCGYENDQLTVEYCYFVNGQSGANIMRETEFEGNTCYETSVVELEVGNTVDFCVRVGGQITKLTNLTINGKAQGFTLNEGVLTCGYETIYLFRIINSEVYISVSGNSIREPYLGAIYVASQRTNATTLYFYEIDGERNALVFRIGNVEVPADLPIALKIEHTDKVGPQKIAGLEESEAKKDFKLEEENTSITYIGTGGKAYDFYLIVEMETGDLYLRIEYNTSID